jgi:mono/diheme cytochrome c family protein
MKQHAVLAFSRIVAAIAVLTGAFPALAAGDADAGADVALRWCTSCHLIRPNATGPVLQGPPSFSAMARESTPDALRAFLAKPHAPMPPVDLSRADIENLLAYIATQR